MAQLKRWFLKLKYKLFPIKKYIPGVHYELINNDHYLISIKVLKGLYEGAEVGFDAVNNDCEDKLKIKTILIKWSYFEYDFTSDPNWCIIAMDIFTYEWEKALENYKTLREEVLTDENDRINYIEEPFTQRTVYKKGDSLSKKRVLSKQKRKTGVSGNSRLHSKVQPPADHGSDTDIFGSEK